jgi:hypothetical protein
MKKKHKHRPMFEKIVETSFGFMSFLSKSGFRYACGPKKKREVFRSYRRPISFRKRNTKKKKGKRERGERKENTRE